MDRIIEAKLSELEASPRDQEDVRSFARASAVAHGLLYSPHAQDDTVIAPLSLLPCPIRKDLFTFAQKIQPDYNLLYHKIAYDDDFLREVFSEIRHSDEFIGRLYDIYELVRREGGNLPISFEISRSDFMIDSTSGMIKQIENNTIACGCIEGAPSVRDFQRSVLLKLGIGEIAETMPRNRSNESAAESMVKAWELYGSQKAIILFIVDLPEPNFLGIKGLELNIQQLNPDIRVRVCTLREVGERAHLTDDRTIFLDDLEVAVVYYRTGYKPQNYPTKNEWTARTMLERSKAICCPAINYQLAGCKKVQQVLCNPGVVERYIDDPRAAADIRQTFANQYSLQGAVGEDAVQLAMKNPESYVLKPQREGGGNNVYDEDIPRLLAKIRSTPELNNYILMERVKPKEHRGCILRNNGTVMQLPAQQLVCEIGMFGVFLSRGDTILKNETAGHGVRTKLAKNCEGGVLHGDSGYDSPYLT